MTPHSSRPCAPRLSVPRALQCPVPSGLAPLDSAPSGPGALPGPSPTLAPRPLPGSRAPEIESSLFEFFQKWNEGSARTPCDRISLSASGLASPITCADRVPGVNAVCVQDLSIQVGTGSAAGEVGGCGGHQGAAASAVRAERAPKQRRLTPACRPQCKSAGRRDATGKKLPPPSSPRARPLACPPACTARTLRNLTVVYFSLISSYLGAMILHGPHHDVE